jgi:TrmH family RNA methyltransferase
MNLSITSKDNKLIREVKSLHQKKNRVSLGKFFIEGIKMVKEAIDHKQKIESVLVCQDVLQRVNGGPELLSQLDALNEQIVFVNETIIKYITDAQTPQGVIAVVSKRENGTSSDFKQQGVYLLLDSIQDPGNMGTIIRTADAAGVSGIFLSKGCCDLYSPKTLRSTMGSIFRVKIYDNQDLIDISKKMQKNGIKIVATTIAAKQNHYEVEYDSQVGVIIGNEANGITQELIDIADYKVKIPMVGNIESLNASVAAGILLFEILRKKLLSK